MSRKRLSKKQLKRDMFVEQTFDWAHWVETHRKQVVAGALAAAVIVAGFFVYRSMTAASEEDAARDYITARQSYFSGNYPLAVSDLEGFLNRHGGSSYADDARFFLADAYLRAGQIEAAIEALDDFLDRHGSSPFADNARRMRAAAYEQAGEYERAAEAYLEAIDRAEYPSLEIELRESLARAYRAAGRTDAAAEQYREILALEPDGPGAARARRHLAEVAVTPLSTAGDPGTGTRIDTIAGAGGEPSLEETATTETTGTGP